MKKRRNLSQYHRAWELRQQGKTLREIGRLMGYTTGEWPRVMIWRTDRKIETQKIIPNELKLLVEKYRK